MSDQYQCDPHLLQSRHRVVEGPALNLIAQRRSCPRTRTWSWRLARRRSGGQMANVARIFNDAWWLNSRSERAGTPLHLLVTRLLQGRRAAHVSFARAGKPFSNMGKARLRCFHAQPTGGPTIAQNWCHTRSKVA